MPTNQLHTANMISLTNYKQSIGLFILAALLLLLKSPDAVTAPQFWAEDGPVFFAFQFEQRWPQLLMPYAGYLHTVSRLVAWAASWFDVAQAPRIYNLSAIAIDAFCISYVSIRVAPWFSTWPVFLSFFIVPTMGDIFGTVTNIHWFMQFAIAAACFAPAAIVHAAPRASRIGGMLLLALAALSGPFSLLIAAVAIGAIVTTWLPAAPAGPAPRSGLWNVLLAVRDAGTRLPKKNVLVVALCACVQAVVLATNPVVTPSTMLVLSEQQKAGLGLLDHEFFYSQMVNYPFALPFNLGLAAIAAVVLIFLIQTLRRPSTWAGIACLLLAVGAMQPVLAFARQHFPASLNVTARYSYLLSVSACWIGWRMFSVWAPAWRTRAAVIIGAVVAMGVVVRPDYFRRRPLYDMAWEKYAAQINHDGPAVVVVPINPAYWNFKVRPRAAVQ